MHTFIIDGGTTALRTAYIQNKMTGQIDLIHVTTDKTSITIKQIHDLQIPLLVVSRIPRLIWLEEANLMTIPAQNALLKLLEEPPANTTFYLTCQSVSMLLPTIRSRCQLHNLPNSPNLPNSANLSELKQIMSLSPGDRLTKLGKMDRTEAIDYLAKIEVALREMFTTPLPDKGLVTLAKIARLTQIAKRQLTENCSVSLVLQTFYLKLPHTHPVK